jgi:transposase
MPKPYSQDLRDRVIDAVEKGEMSRRAAARRYAISESVAVKWLAGRTGWLARTCRARRPPAFQADAAP